MGSASAAKRSRQFSRGNEAQMRRQAKNPSPRQKRREQPAEEAPANLLRLSRNVEQRELRTVTFASFAPEVEPSDLAQVWNAVNGVEPPDGEARCSDTQAFLAFDNEKLAEPMRSRLMQPLNQAALRAHLANPAEYGPTVTRVVFVERERLVVNGVTFSQGEDYQMIVHGRLSAIRRRFPDSKMIEDWQAAGVVFGRTETLKQMEIY